MSHFKTYFNEWAPGYDGDAEILDYLAPAIAGEILSAHLAAETPQIVDLGCGTGMSLAEVRKRFPNARLTGVDQSEGLLKEARKKNLGVEFLQHDLSRGNIRLKRGVNDAVTMVGTLDFIPGNRMIYAFRTAASLLKEAGVFVFTFIPDQNIPHVNADIPDNHPERLLIESILERRQAISTLGVHDSTEEKMSRILAGQNLTILTQAEFRGYNKGNTFIPYQIIVCRKDSLKPAV